MTEDNTPIKQEQKEEQKEEPKEEPKEEEKTDGLDELLPNEDHSDEISAVKAFLRLDRETQRKIIEEKTREQLIKLREKIITFMSFYEIFVGQFLDPENEYETLLEPAFLLINQYMYFPETWVKN